MYAAFFIATENLNNVITKSVPFSQKCFQCCSRPGALCSPGIRTHEETGLEEICVLNHAGLWEVPAALSRRCEDPGGTGISPDLTQLPCAWEKWLWI